MLLDARRAAQGFLARCARSARLIVKPFGGHDEN